MKTTLLAAVAALSLATVTAHAASGDSDPFPLHAPGITIVTPQATADTGSQAYPDLTGRPSWVVTAGGSDGVSMTGSQAGVETANSLPRGFQDGTVAYAQARSVQRYVAAQQANRPTRVAGTALPPNGAPHG